MLGLFVYHLCDDMQSELRSTVLCGSRTAGAIAISAFAIFATFAAARTGARPAARTAKTRYAAGAIAISALAI